MAVGIVIGASFSKIVTSLVGDVIMPPNYGLFVNTVIDFLIVAICIFLVVKGINH